jgi:hypothetical protein
MLQRGDRRIELRSFDSMTVVIHFAIGFGLICVALMIWVVFLGGDNLFLLFPLGPFTLLFAGVGLWARQNYCEDRFFDLNKGLYWAMSRTPDEEYNTRDKTHLRDLRAIQLLCWSRKSKKIYQINLVRTNGQRVQVINGKNRSNMEKKATLLGALLSIEVWNRAQQI